MQDAIRPNKKAFKAMYERGYRTWNALWDTAARKSFPDRLTSIYSVFPNHPYFPEGLAIDDHFSNTVTVRGRNTWTTTRGSCDLEPFEEEVVIQVASSYPTTVAFVPHPHPPVVFSCDPVGESHHVPILMLAWAYILSTRWAELIPGANAPCYSNHQAYLNIINGLCGQQNDQNSVFVYVGDVDYDAARWWTAVLASNSGWDASIRNKTGVLLCSPWSVRIQQESPFVITANVKSCSSTNNHQSASFDMAIRYLSAYCHLHDITQQSQAALAAALLIPVAKFDNKIIELPIPRLQHKDTRGKESTQARPAWNGELRQLDRLLTLSCNSKGIKALLNSIFFEPDISCNICGAWLQGTFAFLDSVTVRDPLVLLSTFVERDPDLGFLWLGAFITGAAARCLQDARVGWWKFDLCAAAWTETHASFIQEAVATAYPVAREISRADECRLMYMSHEPAHTVAPLFPFRPFGSTAMEDLGLDVRRHAQCSVAHGLRCGDFTWYCQDGEARQGRSAMTIRVKGGQSLSLNSITVDYRSLDLEDEVSEMITRNIFTWLRGEDGFPIAERAIREHEWIQDLNSDDDDSPIEGIVKSTTGKNIGRWLLNLSTESADSL